MSKNTTLNPLNGANFIHDQNRIIEAAPIWKRFSLFGKTAIISGSGGGIGFAVAIAYAEMGANVVIWYNKNNAAIEKAKDLSDKYNVQGMIKCSSH